MSRYIDADKLLEFFIIYPDDEEFDVADIKLIIDVQDIADVVEVVRCKDCKRHIENDVGDIFCNYHGISMLENDFCSYGERADT